MSPNSVKNLKKKRREDIIYLLIILLIQSFIVIPVILHAPILFSIKALAVSSFLAPLSLVLIELFKDYEELNAPDIGAEGEKEIQAIIKSQLPEYKIVANLWNDDLKGDLDVILIGPLGLFLLEVKKVNSWKEGIIKWESRTSYAAVLLHELVKDKLGINPWVQTAIVFCDKKERRFRSTRNVTILNKFELIHWISESSEKLKEDDIERIYNFLKSINATN